MEKVQENIITHEDFLSISRRVHYNQYIAEFYERMQSKGKTYDNNVNGLRSCCKKLDFDFYQKGKTKNLVRMNRCKDRFCLNCQALAADQRLAQYAPILDELTKTNDLYHVVLTVPNVDAPYLKDTIKLMLDRFGYLIRFFDGTKRVRDVDFTQYGYEGAVRALEITYNEQSKTYHPHLHCIFVFQKGLANEQVYWNRFSEDRKGRRPPRLFSELDLLFQRMWALLITRTELTKSNIEHIENVCAYPDGFSCRADLSNGKYNEIFKYAIKGTYKNKSILSFETFETMYKALWNVKVYQTYGCLRKYDFNEFDEDLGLVSVDEFYDLYIAQLRAQELPMRIAEDLDYILTATFGDKNEIKYMSKATFVKHFKSLSGEDRAELIEKLYGVVSNKASE